MIPRLKPAVGAKEFIAAFRCPRKDDIFRFERKFARLMEQKYALAFPYGRTGLLLLLKALNIKNQEIICPAYTCVVVPHAILFSGNTPVFVDCEPGSFNMDLDLAVRAVTDKTAAIIPTSVFGYPVNLDKIDNIRMKYPSLHIIQDCAHSFAAKWKGRAVQKEGIAALFGLNISKLLTSVFGGMITTDDKELYTQLKMIRNAVLQPAGWKKSIRRLLYFMAVYPAFSKRFYQLTNLLERSGFLNKFVKYYDELQVEMPEDYLEAMTNIEARVGSANIPRYPDVVRDHVASAKYYFDTLKDLQNFKLPPQDSGATFSHFTVQVRSREEWLQKGIGCGVQFGWLIEYCIPLMKPYGAFSKDKFPLAAKYAETTLNLPVWGGEKIAREVARKILSVGINIESHRE
jgi:dTDP-4-amino-4,6-dideoxygalactose transaminase